MARRRIRLTLRLGALALLLFLAGAAVWVFYPRDTPARRRAELHQAREALVAGRYDESRLLFERFIERYGGGAREHHMVALCLLGLERTQEALARSRRALELDPEYTPALLLAGEVAFARGELDEARTFARRALDVAPAAGAHLLLGRILSRPGHRDLGEAARHLSEAVALGTKKIEAHLLLAEIAFEGMRSSPRGVLDLSGKQHIAIARRGAETLLEEKGKEPSPDIRFFFARCDFATEEYASALEILSELVRSEEAAPAHMLLLARTYHRLGNRVRAGRWLERGIEAEPDLSVLLEIAEEYHRLGLDEAADRVLSTARERYPGETSVVLMSALARIREGDDEGAEAELRAALEASPEDSALLFALAEALLPQAGRAEEGEALVRELGKREGAEGIRARLRLAELLLDGADRSRWREAEKIVADAEREDPRAHEHYRGFLEGKHLLRQGRFRAAVGPLSRAAARLPDTAAPHRLLARAYAVLGEPDREREALTSAILIDGPVRDLLLARANAAIRSGRAALALEDCRRYLSEDPDDEAALVLTGRALLGLRDPRKEEARELFERASSRPGAKVESKIAFASFLSGEGEDDRAAEVLTRSIEGADDPVSAMAATRALANLRDRQAKQTLSEESRALWRRLVDRYPADGACLLHFGIALLWGGEPAEAARVTEQALAKLPQSVAARRVIFEALITEAKEDDAAVSRLLALADEVDRIDPDGSVRLYLRGRIALLEGDPDRAERLLSFATDRSPDDALASLYLGRARFVRGDLRGARRALEASLRSAPRLTGALDLLSRVLLEEGRELHESGDRSGAVERLQEAVRFSRDPIPMRGVLARVSLDAGVRGDWARIETAREECRRLIEDLRKPAAEDAEAKERLGGALVLMASACYAADDLEGMLEASEEFFGLYPTEPRAHHYRASALMVAGRYDDAIESLENALRRFPDRIDLAWLLLSAFARAGKPDEGLVEIREWVERQQEPLETGLLIGAAGLYAGELPDAEAAFRALLEANPGHPIAAQGLATVLLRQGREKEAIREIRDLTEMTGGKAGHLLVLADLLVRAGQTEEGLRILTELSGKPVSGVKVRLISFTRILSTLGLAGRVAEAVEVASRFADWARDEPALERGTVAVSDAWFLAGLAYQQADLKRLGVAALRESLRTQPRNLPALNNLAVMLARDSESVDEALGLALRAVKLAPDVAEVWDTLAMAHLAKSDVVAARGAYEEAIRRFRETEQSRRLAETLVRLALVQLRLGDRRAAGKSLESAVAADGSIASWEEYEAVLASLGR